MKIKNLLTAAAAAATLLVGSSGVASADWYDRHHHRHYTRHELRVERHQYRHAMREYRREARQYRRMINHERVYEIVRAHRYRYLSAPYWYRGSYVVRAYDPYGRLVLVRVDPYTGAWGGIFIRL